MAKQKKYGKSGWFNESRRHSLARRGIKTGRKINTARIVYKKPSKVTVTAHGHLYVYDKEVEDTARLFFIKRFGRDPDHRAEKSYFNEWRHRFYTRSPEDYMDGKSKEVYRKIQSGDNKLPKGWKGKGGQSLKLVQEKPNYANIKMWKKIEKDVWKNLSNNKFSGIDRLNLQPPYWVVINEKRVHGHMSKQKANNELMKYMKKHPKG